MKARTLKEAEKVLGLIRNGKVLTELVKKGLLEKNQAKNIRRELKERNKVHEIFQEASLW